MTSKTCARLILLVGISALAQVRAHAQGSLDSAPSQFGTEPAPYARPAQPVTARAVPATSQPSGVPGGYGVPGAYAPPGYAPQQDMGSLGSPDPSKPLGRGDIVTFSIAQDREPPQTMRVTDTGELDFSVFPKIGRISVAGRTCAQVAAELKHKLEADYYNAADVTLGINQVNHSDSRGRIYLTGYVAAPGSQEMPSNERTTVATVIIRAGGVGQFGDAGHVRVTRVDKVTGKNVTFTVNVGLIINKGRRDLDKEVQDGDYINVPRKLINI